MKLYKFQRECIKEGKIFNGRVLTCLDMGLGKTLTTLASLVEYPKSIPALVVCPASVKYHWVDEGAKLGFTSHVMDGRKPNYIPDCNLVVINYDILQYRMEELIEFGFRTLILDECQFIKDQSTKRYKAIRIIAKGKRYVFALSGTPLVNRPIELFPTLNLINPKRFKSRLHFARRYCAPKWTPWGWSFNGASNLQELNEVLLRTCMVRRRKEEVLKDLPKRVRQVQAIPMINPKEYEVAEKHFLEWLAKRDRLKAMKAAKAEAVTKVGYLLRLAAKKKLWYVVEWINEFMDQTDEKLLVFANHRGAIAAMEKHSKGNPLVIHGGIPLSQRKRTVDLFGSDPSRRLVIGQTRAAGVGLDGLQRACSTVLFAELPWTPGAVDQAISRVHRIGAKGKHTMIHFLVAHGTIEEKVCSLLQSKQSILSSTLDGSDSVNAMPLFDELLRELRR